MAVVTEVSYARWMCFIESSGTIVLDILSQLAFAMLTALSSTPASDDDRMASWSGSVAVAEARKAEGAIMHALLTPRPPMWTGNDACFH